MIAALRRPSCRLSWLLVVCLLLGQVIACKEKQPTPTPTPAPTPTATPSAQRALEDALFTIALDDVVLATEQLRVGESEGQMLVFSEIHRYDRGPIVERRTVVLSPILSPIRYDVELNARGARSIWVGERNGEAMNCFNNNLEWFGPTLAEAISPAPDVVIESAPSALPYALLALRYDLSESAPMSLHTLDVLEDLPVSRPMTVTADPERTGAVIGTVALDGQIEGGRNPNMTMWVRPAGRLLYSVEISDYHAGLWPGWIQPSSEGEHKLIVRRVSKLPELPIPAEPSDQRNRIALDFTGADNGKRSGTLILPDGAGPFPCLMMHSGNGAQLRFDPGGAYAKRGWAVYCYDKRGLGDSEGEYERNAIRVWAQDALAAAAMLREQPQIDRERLVFLGIGEGGWVGALALAEANNPYAGAILGSCASVGPVFPNLAQRRIADPLQAFYGWSAEQQRAYEQASIARWQELLASDQNEVRMMGRRTSLRTLRDLVELDLAQALSQSRAPVLLLHGGQDSWTPIAGAREMAEQVRVVRGDAIVLQEFADLDATLGAVNAEGRLAPEVEKAILDWLDATYAR